MHVPDPIHHVTFYLTTSMEVIGILKSEAHFKCINITVILLNFWQPQLLSFLTVLNLRSSAILRLFLVFCFSSHLNFHNPLQKQTLKPLCC